jgi:hypothetical protein
MNIVSWVADLNGPLQRQDYGVVPRVAMTGVFQDKDGRSLGPKLMRQVTRGRKPACGRGSVRHEDPFPGKADE